MRKNRADSCRYDSDNDLDSDEVCGNVDSCRTDGLNDVDSDAICGDIDSCEFDSDNDIDSNQYPILHVIITLRIMH